jgi:hypothetical protein
MDTDLYRRSIGEWADRVDGGLGALARVACQDMAEEVIDNTPVDTGFLVANWQPSLEAPDVSLLLGAYGNGYAESRLGLVIAEIKAGDTFYFTNNAAYARRIEHGFVGKDSLGRYYNQRGRHMVVNALERWPLIVEGAAHKLGLTK